MDKQIIAILSIFAIFGVMGNVSGQMMSCSFTAITPANDSTITDLTPTFTFRAACNATVLSAYNISLSDGTVYNLAGTNNNTLITHTPTTALSYRTTYFWNITAHNQTISNVSGDYTFVITRFGAAAETINAVRTDLISPIVMFVLALITVFVALFVLSMIQDIFEGIGIQVKKNI